MTSKHSTNMKGVVGKICSKCRYWHPLDGFYICESIRDGLCYSCKYCYKEYAHSEKGKLTQIKRQAKRRGLGFNPVYDNIILEPYCWHHLNHNDVVTVPKDLHVLYTGKGFRDGKHEFMVDQIIKQIYKQEVRL